MDRTPMDLTARVAAYRAEHPSVTEAEAIDAVLVLWHVQQQTKILERLAGADLMVRRAGLDFAFAIADAQDPIDVQTIRDTLHADIEILRHQLAFLERKRVQMPTPLEEFER